MAVTFRPSVFLVLLALPSAARAAELAAADAPLPTSFRWTASPPVLHPAPAGGENWHSVKDPSIVHHDGRWHLFVTVRGTNRSHAIVYLSFADWAEADKAPRHVLSCHEGYFCAPQVFYFMPHKKWYLICQASDASWEPNYQPAFATTENIADPNSWSKLTPLYGYKPADLNGWIDFWVICDSEKAHLFYTSNDGRMWRSETPLASFPHSWSEPVLVLDADIFEASHTYKLKGQEKYLTLIEAENGHGWRYYKAYLADHLDGIWTPLAATKDEAFASMRNVEHPAGRWTDAISHGELLRAGVDEKLEVDPAGLRFLIQGVSDPDRRGKEYGAIPWKLGLLEPTE
jgi:hypothetical protein